MTGTTWRLRRSAAIVCIGLTTAAVVSGIAAAVMTGTALAAGSGGHGDHDDHRDHGGNSRDHGGPPSTVKGTPCTVTARACVDLAKNQAWLIHDGEITRGPVAISHGGQGKETPTGTFKVLWKDEDHKSAEFDDAPMPYSVFFVPGIAFHQGSLSVKSHGCIHLSLASAQKYFATLSVGDQVEVVR
jgi:L,D-transpeptidase catalytic domain